MLLAEDVPIISHRVTLSVFVQTSHKVKKLVLEMNTGFDRGVTKIKLLALLLRKIGLLNFSKTQCVLQVQLTHK